MSRKQKQIEETARALFYKHGISRITIEEICKEASVSKVTFYKYFSNKTELSKHLLQLIMTEGQKNYDKIMKSNEPFFEKIKKVVQMKIEFSKDISQEFIKDIYQKGDDQLKQFLEQNAQQSYMVFRNDLVKAKENGEIRKTANIDLIMYSLNKMREMMEDEHVLNMFQTPQELIHEMTNLFFYGIIPNKNAK